MHIWWCLQGCPQGEKSLPAPWLRSIWWSHTLCISFTYLYIHLYRYLCISWSTGDRFSVHMPKALLILETQVTVCREEHTVAECGNQPRGAQSSWNQTMKASNRHHKNLQRWKNLFIPISEKRGKRRRRIPKDANLCSSRRNVRQHCLLWRSVDYLPQSS